MTYEKSSSAKFLFACFPVEDDRFVKMPGARVRQTRNTSVSSEALAQRDRA
jgi:hypothetical protein